MRSKSGMSEGPEKRRVGVRAEGGREGGRKTFPDTWI